VLMVTTTVWMVNRVHSNTTSTGPVVTLSLEFVVSPTGLEQGFVDPSTTSDNTDAGPRATGDGLFGTGWKTDAGLVVFLRVPNDSSIASGCSGKRTTVTDLLLDIADDRSFWELAHGEDISDVEGSLPAAVDKGASMKALSGDKGLLSEFVTVRITEHDAGKRSTTAGVVDDLFDDTADVAVPFGEVEGT